MFIKIAIDIPSGVLADGNIPEKCSRFSKQMKPCLYSFANNHFASRNQQYCGKIHLEIGISKKIYRKY